MSNISRRKLVGLGAAAAAGVSGSVAAVRVAGEQGLIPPDAGGLYGCGHTLTYAAHRLLTRHSNAREFAASQISKTPHPKGKPPKGDEFKRLQAGGFQDWRLQVDGMVKSPRSLSIAELRNFTERRQITQLICEEGWSYIAEWTGAGLADVLESAGISTQARFAVYHSMDGWVDALDLDEARHGQTLVSFGMNGAAIPVGHGGPLRLRVPKQMGYKSLKFLHRVTLTDTLKGVAGDGDYSWYAGI